MTAPENGQDPALLALEGELVGMLDDSDGGPQVLFRLRLADQSAVRLDLTGIYLPIRDFRMLAGLRLAGPDTVELDDGEQVPIAGSGQLVRDGEAATVTVARLQFSGGGLVAELDLVPAGSPPSAPVLVSVTARLTDRRIVLGPDSDSLSSAGGVLDLDAFDRSVEDGETVLRPAAPAS